MNELQTVENLLDTMDGEECTPPIAPGLFDAARLCGIPPPPEPGIYFGMSDEDYHAVAALSASGIKLMAASPMLFWSKTAWLCEACAKQKAEADEADDKYHRIIGKAYHARILEGPDAYASRFAVALNKADYPDCLESTAQIKAAIQSLGVKPASKVPDSMPDTGEEYMRAAVKADWIAQLLELEPGARVFAAMQDDHREQHAGKLFITADDHARIEIAAAMIERDPEVKDVFQGGYPEVTLIWRCEQTGVLMKARVDYLKHGEMADLKSVANQRELSMEQVVRFAIGSYKYNFQPCVYVEGGQAVRRLIRGQGHEAVHFCGDPETDISELVVWALQWAKQKTDDEWLWVFQQKGDAPVTRGVRFPHTGITDQDTRGMVERAKKRFKQFNEVFGTGPWLDVAPIYTISDEDIPRSATEI